MPSRGRTDGLDFSGLRVLVVGDLMIDRYLRGSVDRISPEAPVPIVHLHAREDRPGGAANVVANLRSLGIRAGVAGAIGRDPAGEALVDLLRDSGASAEGVLRLADRPTTLKTRIIAQDQQLLRLDEETTRPLDASAAGDLNQLVRAMLSKDTYDVIVLQDYNKGVLSETSIDGLLASAREFDVRVVVDPKDANFWAYRNVALFKPNLREIRQQVDFPLGPNLPDLDRAAAVCFSRLNCRSVMITLSEHGIYTNDGNTSAIHPTRARRIIDVSGAGDTVISVAAGALGAGMSVPEAARLANVAGAQVIGRPGVATVDRHELAAEWAREG